jgi:CheY-like chemotaxis protein
MTLVPNRTKSILIVEDDPDTSTTIAEMLRGAGYHVKTAVNRDEAISVLESNGIDTILLDYFMPGQSASKFLYKVRTDFSAIRIILVTAGNRVAQIARMLGIDEYIGKPIQPDKLLDLIR